MRSHIFLVGGLVLVTIFGGVRGQWDPHFTSKRSSIVHLMEWTWWSIGNECETFLGPYGYGGVQVSPPNENLILHDPPRPWYERYQPISYNLTTRSGNEAQFQEMVRRCNAVGVRIYVDAVINHMTIGDGVGVGGCTANGFEYPCLPFGPSDFNGPATCPTSSQYIEDYTDTIQVKNCQLGGLRDLDQGKQNVANKIKEYLNRLISYGVAGFRVDAAKHMWAADLKPIYSTLNDLPTSHGFPAGSRAFFFQEVIDYGSDSFGVEYYDLGRVTEFRYGVELSNAFKGGNLLKWLQNFGEEWDFNRNDRAVCFLDNHDNQRTRQDMLTFRDARLYKMAVAFMLAWPYGVPRIMSSYYWERNFQDGHDVNDWVGPPSTNEIIDEITINPDLSCGGGWICEHRWMQIYNMNAFRNAVEDSPVTNFWSNDNNQIAFCRGNKGFIAINNDPYDMTGSFQTCLPAGEYCDVITGGLSEGRCTGATVRVGQDGLANFSISNLKDDPVLAIHVDAKL